MTRRRGRFERCDDCRLGEHREQPGRRLRVRRRPLDPGSTLGNWMVLHDLVEQGCARAGAITRERVREALQHRVETHLGTSQNRPRESPYGLGRRYQNPRIRLNEVRDVDSSRQHVCESATVGMKVKLQLDERIRRLTGGAPRPKSSSLSVPCPLRIRVDGGHSVVARVKQRGARRRPCREPRPRIPTTRAIPVFAIAKADPGWAGRRGDRAPCALVGCRIRRSASAKELAHYSFDCRTEPRLVVGASVEVGTDNEKSSTVPDPWEALVGDLGPAMDLAVMQRLRRGLGQVKTLNTL